MTSDIEKVIEKLKQASSLPIKSFNSEQEAIDAMHSAAWCEGVYTQATQLMLEALEAAMRVRDSQPHVTGETSDGYHTFSELYEHRFALFSALCKLCASWKSKLHDDGTMFDGWFIAGIETSQGPVTYHLPLRLWDYFLCKELDKAPKWDGHTSSDVVSRLYSVVREERGAENHSAAQENGVKTITVSELAKHIYYASPATFFRDNSPVSWDEASPPYKEEALIQAQAIAKLGAIQVVED